MEQYKPAIKQGVYLGAIGVFIHLITYAIDPELFLSTNYGLFTSVILGLAGPILFMILGAKNSKPNFDFFNFGKAFSAAFLVGLVAALISLSYTLLFNNVIDTEMGDWLYETQMEAQEEKLEEAGYDDEMIEQSMKMADQWKPYTTGNLGAVLMHGLFMFWYLILALIVGAVQRTKGDPFNNEVNEIGS